MPATRPAAWPRRSRRRCHRRTAPPLHDRPRARRRPAHRLQDPPRFPVPALRRGLPGQHLPAHPRRAKRRQGNPRHRRHPSVRLRHTHRTLIRPCSRPPRERWPGPEVPPRRSGRTCRHGRCLSCAEKHACDDTRLGEPLCPDCYDYTGAVLFNACAPELWRRFAITLRRSLARQAGLTNKALAALREHHRQQAEERLAAGSAWNDTGGLVFTSRWGEPLYPDTVTALMTKLINRHNMSVTPPGKPLPHVRLHDLRHLHATTLQMSRVASDASLPGKRDHGAVREREPGSPAPAAGRQSKTAGQADRDITMLQRVPRCRVQFGCIAR